jgi:hypothetical protein
MPSKIIQKLGYGMVAVTAALLPLHSYAQQCSLPARSLTQVGTGRLLTGSEREVRLNTRTGDFFFLVPNRVFTSGALIVKSRHLLPKTNGQSGIDLKRNAYTSPCTGREQGGYFRPNVGIAKYRAYHFYLDRDTDPDPNKSLNSFHADVRSDDVRKCVRTSDEDIRPQFLYDPPDERRTANARDRAVRVVSDATRFFKGGTAYADTGSAGYSGLRTEIVPYRKRSQEHVCVHVNISVPENALKTNIMIVDVEDALDPGIRDTRMVTQSEWTVIWR